MIVTHNINIAGSEAVVWKVVADDFDKIEGWNTHSITCEGLKEERGITNGAKGLTGRVNTQPDGVDYTETFTKFSADDLTFTYNITGLPSFAKEATNTWKVESVTETESKLTLQI